ncbi:hypothetical protein [Paenibacillus xylanexedens]|uniref:PRC-barrel domain-containing protein n=1 Tax=Paenibacillus xylanexedens TaxID=528191 RepID=A0ABS4RLN6_PAEXY|nr:hypothetical protein [Paenibacillus xylanexedens]MBP2243811.1 hypothetical protein [Paenibacillus xylanexedens]
MLRFRKKPVVIGAVQWSGDNIGEISDMELNYELRDGKILIPTLEGTMAADLGDWIIRGVDGEFYPCKPHIFNQTYERVI